MPDLQDMSGSENEEDDKDTEAINAAYEHTKALRDADRVAMKTRPKADLTKDIQPIFKEEEVPDSDIGVLVKGHWCLLCQKNGLPQKKCFLTGNVSLRRTHISREDPKQTTLDNFANKTPPFSCQGFLDYLVEMMVTEDDGFMLVDKGPFRRLLRYCRPSLKESDIPHPLDPNIKTAYAEESWNSEALNEGLSKLEAVFDDYYIAPNMDVVVEMAADSESPMTAPVQYGHSWIRAKVQGHKNKDFAAVNPREELRADLEAALQNIDDVVAWRGHHSSQYPTLARIALDYLAIQGSAVAGLNGRGAETIHMSG
ncbi:hypothetical protein B0H14DRAFT_3448096 [Mycena olivaceomarginata]|nr:hypothetical protein B0H14DRAFT_3448096 [Mycena olivaceomarginata]